MKITLKPDDIQAIPAGDGGVPRGFKEWYMNAKIMNGVTGTDIIWT